MRTLLFSLAYTLLIFIFPPRSASFLVLQNTSYVDVEKGSLVSNVDIVIHGSLIYALNPYSPKREYPNSRIVDLNGHYIIPGLIEGHTHISTVPEKSLEIALRHGVTSLRDMAGDGEYLKLLQDAVISGELTGPDIYFSALMGGEKFFTNNARVKLSTPPSYQPGEAPWMRCVYESSDIRKIISDARECGATGIKLYAYLPADLVRKLSDEAKRQGLKVWAHWEVFPATLEEVVEAGVETVSHIYFLLTPPGWKYSDGSSGLSAKYANAVRNENLFTAMKKNHTALDPTLTVASEMFVSITDSGEKEELFRAIYGQARSAHERGVKLIAGTDVFLPRNEKTKLPLHEEMEILVLKIGLTPMEALRAATIYNAEILGIEENQGSIEEGKVANLVILNKNPLDNIDHVEEVKFVIKNGKIIN